MANVVDLAMLVICLMVFIQFSIKYHEQSELIFPMSPKNKTNTDELHAYREGRDKLLRSLLDIMAREQRCRILCSISTIIVSARVMKYFKPYPQLDIVARTL